MMEISADNWSEKIIIQAEQGETIANDNVTSGVIVNTTHSLTFFEGHNY